jgi:hypothetical protein
MKKHPRTKSKAKAHQKNNFARKAARVTASDPCRCKFVTSDGRQCSLPRWQEGKRAFCRSHSQQEDELFAPNRSAQELLSFSGEFKTFNEVNHVLGKLWTQLAKGKIPRSDAIALAYIGQLLLQSLHSVRNEVQSAQGYTAWKETLQEVLELAQSTKQCPETKVSIAENIAPGELAEPEPDSDQPVLPESSEDSDESKEEDPDSESPAPFNPAMDQETLQLLYYEQLQKIRSQLQQNQQLQKQRT